MVPDLPRVLTDAPDADVDGRSPATSCAYRSVTTPPGRPFPADRGPRLATVLVAMLVCSALAAVLFSPVARADDLTNRRDQLKQQLAKTKSDLNESSSALNKAAIAVDEAQNRLDEARARLAQTRDRLAAAQARDTAVAARLKQAQADLARAKAAVVAGQAKLDAKRALAGAMVRIQYQQQTNLAPIAVLTDPQSTSDLATRMQWATTMFDTTQATIDGLIETQRRLSAERAKQATLEAQVASDRADAAAALKTTQQLRAQAAADASSVAGLLTRRQAVQKSAAGAVAQDRVDYAALSKERSSVEQRILARIAKARAVAAAEAKAAAARRAAADRAAARARAQAREARAAAAHARSTARARSVPAAHRRPVSTRSASRSSRHTVAARSSFSSAHHGFIYPVNGPITSPFGMRFHPVLHVWKLHDGTDFGAACGAPIYAAYRGTVQERYFNAGYGNRLIIDHGQVDGTYVSTAYNHAIRYVVSPGQHVSQGQLIGYVGETGYATGCHLHLMVYLNGRMVNPMTWY